MQTNLAVLLIMLLVALAFMLPTKAENVSTDGVTAMEDVHAYTQER